jgi:hypothetical protein
LIVLWYEIKKLSDNGCIYCYIFCSNVFYGR